MPWFLAAVSMIKKGTALLSNQKEGKSYVVLHKTSEPRLHLLYLRR